MERAQRGRRGGDIARQARRCRLPAVARSTRFSAGAKARFTCPGHAVTGMAGMSAVRSIFSPHAAARLDRPPVMVRL